MCDVCDPYAVVLLVDGRLGLLELKEQQEGDEEETHLELQWPDIEKVIHTGCEELLYLSSRVLKWCQCHHSQTTVACSPHLHSHSLAEEKRPGNGRSHWQHLLL